MMTKFFTLICLIGMSVMSVHAEDQKPEPGKQVPQKIMLPKSTSVWESPEKANKDNPAAQTRSPERILKMLGEIKPLDSSGMEEVQYLLYLPGDYQPKSGKKWPLLLFLHGAGERGDNIDTVTVHGPPGLIAKNEDIAKKCPFIVVSPQCRNERYWSVGQLQLLLDDIEKNYEVDKDRIYVTGLSMGGFGSWMLACDTPERFAAVAPICGGCSPDQATRLIRIPIWAFHGDADPVVPVSLTKNMVKAIRDAGGKEIKETIYPGVGHDSWVQAYKTPELYQWFLSRHRGDGK
ncbi:MAG: alpha/beta hydrolase-fold protein [Planctomycetaceae bacterium]|nr:alpha/beta hydrolase-fold protein [Planctomycetaceae bacterium]